MSSEKTLKVITLAEEGGPDPVVMRMTREERIELLWELTRHAWKVIDGNSELRLRRDVTHIVRGGR